MAFIAVLDACVLYPASLRDTLLRLAQSELYDLAWSDQILDEMARNLVKNAHLSDKQVTHLQSEMRKWFPDAAAPAESIRRIESTMPVEPGDRHVLAAAVVSSAQTIVTSNLRHFPANGCGEFGVEPVDPDTFLLDLYDLDGDIVIRVISDEAAALTNPPVPLAGMLEHLHKIAPRFSDTVSADLFRKSEGSTIQPRALSKRS